MSIIENYRMEKAKIWKEIEIMEAEFKRNSEVIKKIQDRQLEILDEVRGNILRNEEISEIIEAIES